jgi:hypothetical protein
MTLLLWSRYALLGAMGMLVALYLWVLFRTRHD